MAVLGMDLGGTKLSVALFTTDGKMIFRESILLDSRKGSEVGLLLTEQLGKLLEGKESITSVGVSVPGISRVNSGTVWAPNIPGWEDYPLLEELKKVAAHIPVAIHSDRACYILGERWQGAAKGCRDAIFLAVGTGIGAGILVNGEVLRGAQDIAGAIGWMALDRPYRNHYMGCGCFEYHASGTGIANVARQLLDQEHDYAGILSGIPKEQITAHDIFKAYAKKDALAIKVIEECIVFWGMAVANLVSMFNPEKIIFGGGVFGPAAQLMNAICTEAALWAQPVSMKQVKLEMSALGSDAGIYGAGFLALQNLTSV